MGLFDYDAVSTVSRRSSRHSSSKHHHRDKDEKPRIRGLEVRKPRSRSRSRGRRDSSSHSRSRSRNRSTIRIPKRSGSGTRSVNISARSFFGLDGHHSSHHANRSSGSVHHANKSTASFFSLPNVSSRSIFSTFGRGAAGGSAASFYRRSPRSNFLQRTYKKLKRLLRDLIYYAKKHPFKVFMLAIMPLITGGALTALLARFGLRLPSSIERMMGMGARAMSGDSVGLVGEAVRMAAVAGTGAGAGAGAVRGVSTSLQRGRSGNLQWERRSTERDYFGRGPASNYSYSDSGSGWGGSLAGITKIFS